MARSISPEIWRRYIKLRAQGYTWTQAADAAPLSRQAAKRFEDRDPASSGRPFFPLADAETVPGRLDKGPIPLDKVCPEAQRALEDFAYFRRRYMGNISTPWQVETAEAVIRFMATPEKEFVVWNMPPGTGKTTLVHDLCAWLTVRDRAIRGLIGSYSATMAERMLGRLKRTFERRHPVQQPSELVAAGVACDAEATLWEDFGRFKPEDPERWARKEFIVEQLGGGGIAEKESTWTAYGRDSSENLGQRYMVVFWDDLVNKKNMRSMEVRQELFEWYEDEAESRLDPGGLFGLLGQRISSVDLYRHAIDMRDDDEQPKYHHIVYPAHREDDCKGPDFHQKDSPPWPDGCLLDPFRVSWRELQTIRKNRSEKFHTTYQQEDTDPDDVLVDPLWLSGGTDRNGVYHPGCWDKGRNPWELPSGLANPIGIITIDPSPTRFWACQAWAYVPPQEHVEDGLGGVRYLLDLENRVMDAPDLLDFNFAERCFYGLLEDWWRNYHELGVPLETVVVEQNGAQRFLLQYDHARRWQASRNAKIVGHNTHARNKLSEELGVPIVGPHYAFGRVRLPGSAAGRIKVAPLVHQITRWPDTHQDDQVMANWFLEANLPAIWMPPSTSHRAWRPSWLRRTA